MLFLLANCIYSQREGNIWLFGYNAGIDFNSGSPVALLSSQIYSQEVSACISDRCGNLLMSYDANMDRVLNRNNLQMPDGDSITGNPTTTQAIIVPKPGSSSIYYLFVTPNINNGQCGTEGMRYTIIDMTLDGGNGNVISKNNLLLDPSSEKVTAVKHANGTDIWIIGHECGNNAFYSFLLTNTGIIPTPVISNVGLQYDSSNYSIGYMKASPDGSKLAVAMQDNNVFQLFNFNNATGSVSNPIIFQSANYHWNYGIEFSPDGSKLYVSTTGAYPPTLGNIYQFDLLAGTPTGIINSATLVAQPVAAYTGALQLGPDGKIYVARYFQTYLGIINNPNESGTSCNYVDAGLSLAGKQSTLGLPTILTWLNNLNPLDFSFNNLCLRDTTDFNTVNTSNIDSVAWNFDDPGSGSSNTSRSFNPNHVFTGTGSYNVELYAYYCNMPDTITKTVNIISPSIFLGNDSTVCEGNSFNLDPGSGYPSYLWQDGSTSQTMTPDISGTYWVKVIDNNNCSAYDTMNLTVISSPVIDLGNDTNICTGNTLFLNPGPGYLYYKWHDNSTFQVYGAKLTGIYSVKVTNINNCTGTDSIQVTVSDFPYVFLGTDSFICTPITLHAGEGFESYLWQDGSNNSTFTTEEPGTYSVQITNICGITSDTVTYINCIMPAVWLPNAFTPNYDNTNDVFMATGVNIESFKMTIFNKWGQRVFYTESMNIGWDGTHDKKECADGIYPWIAEYRGLNEKKITIKYGYVLLMK